MRIYYGKTVVTFTYRNILIVLINYFDFRSIQLIHNKTHLPQNLYELYIIIKILQVI